MKLIFDVETNGLFNCSVLSFSALLLSDDNKIIEEIDRYYYKNKNEDDNYEALDINGLYENVIKKIERMQTIQSTLKMINISLNCSISAIQS